MIIKDILQVDLDGDQKNEVIIYATNSTELYNPRVGDYSIVIMRHVENEKIITDVLNFAYQNTACPDYNPDNYYMPCWLSQFKISGILDLNGDGTMEVITTNEIDHGRGITVYEFTAEGLKMVLNWFIGD